VLENCACEPEIEDLAILLNAMGASIDGAGKSTITIEGRDGLGGGRHRILPDRIEAGTYLIGAVMTAGDVTVEDTDAVHLAPLLEKLAAMGATVSTPEGGGVRVAHDGSPLGPHGIVTEPHPGFPTDLQAQYMALATQAAGKTTVAETVFENRFQHVPELQRLGASIRIEGIYARVEGPTPLSGARVMATDLRASASLVLAGLIADGETVVDRLYHLDRGYEDIEGKLRALGARTQRFHE
jgi:UDP-N-acetylglucosamine 1-carboxyvinyltransferase